MVHYRLNTCYIRPENRKSCYKNEILGTILNSIMQSLTNIMNTNTCASIIFFILYSSLALATELIGVNPDELVKMQNDKALIIDIRTAKEWKQTGIIPGSHKIEFFDERGRYDIEHWLKQLKSLQQSPDQAIVLVCRSGKRSKAVGDLLTQKLGMNNVYHLQNGIKSWLKEGKKIDKNCSNSIDCNKK